jgi:hypothetical protein
MPEEVLADESLEIRNWTEVRCFNIPVNEKMLTPDGFTRQLTCVLKSECPRKVSSKLRLVKFDREYVLSKLNKIKSELCLSREELADLLPQ